MDSIKVTVRYNIGNKSLPELIMSIFPRYMISTVHNPFRLTGAPRPQSYFDMQEVKLFSVRKYS